MRTSIRIARILQLVGVLLIFRACTGTGSGSTYLGFGLAIILAARIFEWLTKE